MGEGGGGCGPGGWLSLRQSARGDTLQSYLHESNDASCSHSLVPAGTLLGSIYTESKGTSRGWPGGGSTEPRRGDINYNM